MNTADPIADLPVENHIAELDAVLAHRPLNLNDYTFRWLEIVRSIGGQVVADPYSDEILIGCRADGHEKQRMAHLDALREHAAEYRGVDLYDLIRITVRCRARADRKAVSA